MPPDQLPKFSFLILLTILLVVATSSVTFWLLVRRLTSRRQWVALSEWARDTGFQFTRDAQGTPPAPFADLPNVRPVVLMQLSKGPTTFAQFETGGAASGGPQSAPAPVPAALKWNLVIRQIGSNWRPTGLRPANAARAVLDLFSLSSFPTLGATERFLAYGTDSAAARAVSKSMLRSLLPADVGLLLHGPHLVLDFSGRPFDTMELSRLLALADQLATHLPAAP